MSLGLLFKRAFHSHKIDYKTQVRMNFAWQTLGEQFVDDVIVPLLTRFRELNRDRFHDERIFDYPQDELETQLKFAYEAIYRSDSVHNIIAIVSYLLGCLTSGRYNEFLYSIPSGRLDNIILQHMHIMNPNVFVHFVEAHLDATRRCWFTPDSMATWISGSCLLQSVQIQVPETLVALMRRAGAIKPFERAVHRVASEWEEVRPYCQVLLDAIHSTSKRSAVAMALHGRLGEKSQLNCLSQDLVATIAGLALDKKPCSVPEIDDLEYYYFKAYENRDK